MSSLDFELEASDRVAALLMSDSSGAAYELQGALTTASVAASVDASGISTGDVIWLGDEAIHVGSASGTSLTSLTRGYWGTVAQSHDDDTSVFARLPYWRSRKVDLIEVDVRTGTITTRWRGLVSDISQDEARISMRCEELLGVLAGATVNNQGTDLSPGNLSLIHI